MYEFTKTQLHKLDSILLPSCRGIGKVVLRVLFLSNGCRLVLTNRLLQGKLNKGTIYLLTQIVIQSEAKDLEYIKVGVPEILPPFGRLDDTMW